MKSILKRLSFVLLVFAMAFSISCSEAEEVLGCSQCSDSAKWSTGVGGDCYASQSACEDDTGSDCKTCN